MVKANTFMSLAQNVRRGLLPRKTTDLYAIVHPRIPICNHPMHTDVVRVAYEVTETGYGNVPEPAGSQETGLEFGGGGNLNPRGSLSLPPRRFGRKVLHASVPDFGSLVFACEVTIWQELAVRCLPDGVVGHVAWFA